MPGTLYAAHFNVARFESCVEGNLGGYVPAEELELDGLLGFAGCASAMALLETRYGGKQTDWGCVAAALTRSQVLEFVRLFYSSAEDRARVERKAATLSEGQVYLLVSLET